MRREFEYVGPTQIRDDAKGAPAGVSIAGREAVLAWLADPETGNADDDGWATYVVDVLGKLVIAPRRTEHVACAKGGAVLAAGEIRFGANGEVLEVTNNSTGYCPSEDCWESVDLALDRARLRHPTAFTFVARFRRCPACTERNLVKDEWYQCAFCDADLPIEWNFDGRSKSDAEQ